MFNSENVTKLFVTFNNEKLNQQVERHRIAYERTHGPTDITKYYTSLRPPSQQEWLLEHDPQRYFDGLPPFFRDYLIEGTKNTAKTKPLDSLPSSLIRLVLREKNPDNERPQGNRER